MTDFTAEDLREMAKLAEQRSTDEDAMEEEDDPLAADLDGRMCRLADPLHETILHLHDLDNVPEETLDALEEVEGTLDVLEEAIQSLDVEVERG
jgi:hypothetical protein